MSKEHTPFRYDHAGSFLRPAKLKRARLDFQAGKIDAAALKAVSYTHLTLTTKRIV